MTTVTTPHFLVLAEDHGIPHTRPHAVPNAYGIRMTSSAMPSHREGIMGERPLISVIVPVYNERALLPRTFASIKLAADHHGRVEVIYVDNGSTDGSRECLEELREEGARVFDLPEGTVGAVRNHGAAQARGEYLSFLDADCSVSIEYFSEAVETLATRNASATGSPVALPEDAGLLERVWDRLHAPPGEGPVHYLNSGNFFCRADAFHDVGGFDATLESGEDAELGLRLGRHGYLIYLNPSLRVVHHGNPASLIGFLRRQIWHGMGALGTFQHSRIDRPLLMTVGHIVLTLVGICVVIRRPSMAALALACSLMLAAPAVTVAYRMLSARRITNPVLGALLYLFYYSGRSAALGLLALRHVRRILVGS